MPEFVLEISGSADALDTLGADVTPFAVYLDRVATITTEARAILAARGVAVGLDEPVGSGTW